MEEKESALKFTAGFWNLIGEAAEIRRTDERSGILSALLIADEPMSPPDLAIAANMARNNVDQFLYKMAKAGEVQKTGRGRYIHPDRPDLDRQRPAPRKNDKKIRSGTETLEWQGFEQDEQAYRGLIDKKQDKKPGPACLEPEALDNKDSAQ